MRALLRLRFVAHEPIVWRMQPEILAHGIVVFELLGAGAGNIGQPGGGHRCGGRDNQRRAHLQPRCKTHSQSPMD
jgi:hypothetical protein